MRDSIAARPRETLNKNDGKKALVLTCYYKIMYFFFRVKFFLIFFAEVNIKVRRGRLLTARFFTSKSTSFNNPQRQPLEILPFLMRDVYRMIGACR